ncbi:MAG: thiopurine S-methyltransferase [Alteromonadaceae bacterium]|jgi:thiopurine S-methyltransferase
MKPSFWHKCWERNALGFHQETVQPFLEQFLLPRLTSTTQHVFLPLCGKSLDMVWLAQKMKVSGSELSEIACRDFFQEKDLPFQQHQHHDFTIFSHQNIELWQGDFFKLLPAELGNIDWIYDRAALIALPMSMQQQYAQHLSHFISDQTSLFLISLEFPQEELAGPPFSISSLKVVQLFSGFTVDCIAEQELTDKKFAQRTFNVSHLVERLYLIKKK